MALITKRIYRISDSHSALNAAQIGVEATPDGDLGFKMYGGKDDAGSITKWLAKDKPGMLSTLNLSGASTTGSVGLIQHDTLGNLTGGQLTVAEFNTFISDGGVQWTRDAGNTRLLPLVSTDKINVGMGTEATPGVAFGSATSSGMYYGVVTGSYNGLGFSVGGDQVVGLAKDSGASIIQGAGNLDFSILHQRTDASGSADMLIENSCNQTGIPATMTIKNEAINASSIINMEAFVVNIDCYQQINLTAQLQDITIQAQGLGIICEATYFEFENYAAYSPIPVWNSGTQWAAYESAFGVSYPILQALVDLSTGGAGAHNSLTGLQGGTTDEYYHLDAADYSDVTTYLPVTSKNVVYGGAGGELKHSTRLTFDDTTDTVEITNGNNTTNWYDAGGAALRITGTATQGQAIVSDKNLILALYNTTASYNPFVQVLCANDGVAGNCSMTVSALEGRGSGNLGSATFASYGADSADARTSLTSYTASGSPGGDAEIRIWATAGGGNDAYVDLVGDWLDLNSAEIRAADHVNYTRDTITVTTNAFELNQNDSSWQKVTITANSTWGIRAPANNLAKTFLEIYNSGGSDYTLTITAAAMKDSTGAISACDVYWVDPLTDGFTIPAGELVVATIFYLGEAGGEPQWCVSANETTKEPFGE